MSQLWDMEVEMFWDTDGRNVDTEWWAKNGRSHGSDEVTLGMSTRRKEM